MADGPSSSRRAQRCPMACNSRVRASMLRSRLSRSKRSLSATVIAPVMVSPVRLANSLASRQASSFLDVEAHRTSLRVEVKSACLPYHRPHRPAQRRPPTGRVLSRTQSFHFVQRGCHVSGFRFPSRIVSQRQSWAAGIGTRVSMRFTPETITFVVPSHRDTTPLAKSTRLPNSFRHRAKTRGQRMS